MSGLAARTLLLFVLTLLNPTLEATRWPQQAALLLTVRFLLQWFWPLGVCVCVLTVHLCLLPAGIGSNVPASIKRIK